MKTTTNNPNSENKTMTDTTNEFTFTTNESILTADENNYGWYVTDSAGCVWLPKDKAYAQIIVADDPAAAARLNKPISRQAPPIASPHIVTLSIRSRSRNGEIAPASTPSFSGLNVASNSSSSAVPARPGALGRGAPPGASGRPAVHPA